jgi:hypothetical protein
MIVFGDNFNIWRRLIIVFAISFKQIATIHDCLVISSKQIATNLMLLHYPLSV